MKINKNSTVGEIVRTNFKTAPLFEKNNIDFCCGGGVSLEKACQDKNLELDTLIGKLDEIVSFSDPDSRFIENMRADNLCDYIEERHHTYVRKTAPFIQQKLQKLCDVHGENHPELFTLKELFTEAAQNLKNHMFKEEDKLFPYIRMRMSADIDSSEQVTTDETILSELEDEHEAEGRRFEFMENLTDGFAYPSDACNTYITTFKLLKEFKSDLHRHIHLENNVLFQKMEVILDKVNN